ncbi:MULTISPECIES: DNA polymerase III subunit delta [Pseudoalteromonas]|uniref:DNA polymerase III subunit delta n=1 Tax=Pseudoalteromonas amylolytica TaxID=1859457 RepID=A0A1S1MQ04_9GAMM|nr:MULTISPECIES: DNA polymerase III subunit delta [Pseudoalteromonas]OHU85727.1 DNA polymerase III subunit delta [Pseudoalteromonas sp. JW3]OHU87371.1 DNA polymerase III subunit delta [Pseudoalteromonas amylolytica]
MRCYANQLTPQLKRSLAPFYMVFGEEPFQEANCVLEIKQVAKKQGFDEVIKFNLLPGFDWQELIAQYNSMSLFSARTIIEFDLNQQKPGTQGSQIFKSLSENPNPDVILILKGAKAGQDIQRTAWFKALDKQGVFVPCYVLAGNHLSRWLDEQCKHLKLNLTVDAKRSLLGATEGNLLATYQELEKLSLLYKSESIEQSQVLAGLLNQAKFDIFDLNTALLSGNAKQVIKVMLKLADDNVEPTSIVWTLNKEAQTLLAIKQGMQAGQNTAQLFKQHGIWKNQQAATSQALDRLTLVQIENLINLLAQFDSAYKRAQMIAPYQALAHIALAFCQPVNFSLPHQLSS